MTRPTPTNIGSLGSGQVKQAVSVDYEDVYFENIKINLNQHSDFCDVDLQIRCKIAPRTPEELELQIINSYLTKKGLPEVEDLIKKHYPETLI